jgi:hypothetical protein
VLDQLEWLGIACGCRLLVAPVPARVDLQGSLGVFRSLAGRRAFDVVDVAPALKQALSRDHRSPKDLFFVHDDHLNVYGNRLYGEAIATEVARRLADRR